MHSAIPGKGASRHFGSGCPTHSKHQKKDKQCMTLRVNTSAQKFETGKKKKITAKKGDDN